MEKTTKNGKRKMREGRGSGLCGGDGNGKWTT